MMMVTIIMMVLMILDKLIPLVNSIGFYETSRDINVVAKSFNKPFQLILHFIH